MHRANHPKPSAKAAVSGCGPCAGMIMVYLFHENDGCAEWTLPHTENLTIIDGPPDWKRSRRFQKLHLTQSHRWEIRYIHIYIWSCPFNCWWPDLFSDHPILEDRRGCAAPADSAPPGAEFPDHGAEWDGHRDHFVRHGASIRGWWEIGGSWDKLGLMSGIIC